MDIQGRKKVSLITLPILFVSMSLSFQNCSQPKGTSNPEVSLQSSGEIEFQDVLTGNEVTTDEDKIYYSKAKSSEYARILADRDGIGLTIVNEWPARIPKSADFNQTIPKIILVPEDVKISWSAKPKWVFEDREQSLEGLEIKVLDIEGCKAMVVKNEGSLGFPNSGSSFLSYDECYLGKESEVEFSAYYTESKTLTRKIKIVFGGTAEQMASAISSIGIMKLFIQETKSKDSTEKNIFWENYQMSNGGEFTLKTNKKYDFAIGRGLRSGVSRVTFAGVQGCLSDLGRLRSKQLASGGSSLIFSLKELDTSSCKPGRYEFQYIVDTRSSINPSFGVI